MTVQSPLGSIYISVCTHSHFFSFYYVHNAFIPPFSSHFFPSPLVHLFPFLLCSFSPLILFLLSILPSLFSLFTLFSFLTSTSFHPCLLFSFPLHSFLPSSYLLLSIYLSSPSCFLFPSSFPSQFPSSTSQFIPKFFLLVSLSFLRFRLPLLFPSLPAVASVCFDDEACGGGGGSSVMSEEDSETRSTCSLGSSPSSPQELLSPCPFASSSSSSCASSSASPSPTPSTSSSPPSPLSRPCSLDLPSTVSLSDFGLISPVLGPRSECSGASSPECDLERGDRAEGAEGDLDNAPASNNNNNSTPSTKKSFSLEARFSFLNLRRPRTDKNTDNCSQKAAAGQTLVLVKGV